MQSGLVDALVALGVAPRMAADLAHGIFHGGIVLLAFAEDPAAEFAPAVRAFSPSVDAAVTDETVAGNPAKGTPPQGIPLKGMVQSRRIRFLNMDALREMDDPTARRFCLLEMD